MAPLIESLSSDNGSLAASYFRSGYINNETACYTRHIGYGMGGDFAAKTAGVRHMWHELVGG